MDLKHIVNKLSKESRLKVLMAVEINQKHMEETKKYDKVSLIFLFKEWHKIFPQLKHGMKIDCEGCRKAVFSFWSQVSIFLKNENK